LTQSKAISRLTPFGPCAIVEVMAIRKVAQLGHPVLRQVAEKVSEEDISSERIQTLIDDMIDTMREYDGVGLAAPQVHESLQIAVMEIANNPRYPDEEDVPVTVFINPKITFLTEKKIGVWEGCLSVHGLRGYVERPEKIRLEALDRFGKKIDEVYEGFPAVAIQHETDHLFGKVFLDRMTDMTKLSFLDEFRRYHLAADEPDME
jgi:peptide deformylase